MLNTRGRRAQTPEEQPTNGELRDALTMLAQVVANQVNQGAQAPHPTTPGAKVIRDNESSGVLWVNSG